MATKRPNLSEPSQSDLRATFARNLRLLLRAEKSVSSLARELGIHRSLINRYLDGVSFPRPEILYKICKRFDVDARILLEPLDQIEASIPPQIPKSLINLHPEIADHFIIGDTPSDTAIMPTGIYQFTRGCFVAPDMYQTGLIKIYERDGFKFSRGYMSRDVAVRLGVPLNSRAVREYRGAVYGTERGVVSQAAHLGAKSCSFTYLDLANFVERSCLVGYCARTMLGTAEIGPVTPAVYVRLSDDLGEIQRAARLVGIQSEDKLPSFIRDRLLERGSTLGSL